MFGCFGLSPRTFNFNYSVTVCVCVTNPDYTRVCDGETGMMWQFEKPPSPSSVLSFAAFVCVCLRVFTFGVRNGTTTNGTKKKIRKRTKNDERDEGV